MTLVGIERIFERGREPTTPRKLGDPTQIVSSEPSFQESNVRILLVEDHPLMVEGIRTSIGADHDIVQIIANGDEVLPWLRRNDVDLVTLDLSLPNLCGAEVLPDILALPHPPRVLVVTMHDAPSIGNWMRALGAHGFISKDAPLGTFRSALAEVGAGRTWFPAPEEEHGSRPRSSRWTPELRLTRRQYDVLDSLGDDLSRKGTAARLHITEYTVDEHLAALRRVFKVSTNPALIRAAIEHGFLPQLSVTRLRPRICPN